MAKLKKIRSHDRRHRDFLDERWSETDLTRSQAEQIIKRIDSILELLPQALRQACERIIGGRLVPSKDKILLLYEPDINRGAGQSRRGGGIWKHLVVNRTARGADHRLEAVQRSSGRQRSRSFAHDSSSMSPQMHSAISSVNVIGSRRDWLRALQGGRIACRTTPDLGYLVQ